MKEWKYQGDLFTFVAPLCEQEKFWCVNHDEQELYYCVEVVLSFKANIFKIVLIDAKEDPFIDMNFSNRWWQTKKYYLQHHSNQTIVRWRARLLQYDMKTSHISAQLKWARFKLFYTK